MALTDFTVLGSCVVPPPMRERLDDVGFNIPESRGRVYFRSITSPGQLRQTRPGFLCQESGMGVSLVFRQQEQ